MSHPRRALFGIQIDAVTLPQAVQLIGDWISEVSFRCRYIVTPNVDHAVLLRDSQTLREAYSAADLVLADGFPVVWASRLLGKPVPQRVAGSDLVPAVMAESRADAPRRVFLLGAAAGVAEQAAAKIESRWPTVEVVGCYSPPLGFEKDPVENRQIVARINAAMPDILVLGLGARNKSAGFTSFTIDCKSKSPCVPEPLSIFSLNIDAERRSGCNAAAWSGVTACSVNPADWSNGTPPTPGSFHSWFGNSGEPTAAARRPNAPVTTRSRIDAQPLITPIGLSRATFLASPGAMDDVDDLVDVLVGVGLFFGQARPAAARAMMPSRGQFLVDPAAAGRVGSPPCGSSAAPPRGRRCRTSGPCCRAGRPAPSWRGPCRRE